MIISHKYKYLFVELPRTGSTAISKELRTHYDGTHILHKHATYLDFLKVANADEKKYFVFSCIRNPLDDAVSLYYKYKSDHKARYTDPAKASKKRGFAGYFHTRTYHALKKTEMDFSTYFMRYYLIPYNNWAALSHKDFDFIIRFENLADDFAKALKLIGIESTNPLPMRNKTNKRGGDFIAHYSPETIRRAKRVFGPFMKEWGYEFPPEWGATTTPWWNQLEFEFFNIFRMAYWKYLRGRLQIQSG